MSENMTMQEVENSILQDLDELGDTLTRSEFLIRCGKVFTGIPENERSPEDLIKDCQTDTWVQSRWVRNPKLQDEPDRILESDQAVRDDDVLEMRADSQSLVVKGALSLIDEIFHGRKRKEVREFDCRLVNAESFYSLFSDRQRQGIKSIVKKLTAAE